MKNLKLLLVGAAITPILVLADTPYLTTNLSAGSTGVDVGSVQVTNDTNGDLTVRYILEDPVDITLPLSDQMGKWCITEYHLDVQSNLDDIPQTKKNKAIPGQFLYSGEAECAPSETVNVKNDGWAAGDEVVVAAHAVVEQLTAAKPDLQFEFSDIPVPQQVSSTFIEGVTTYMTATVTDSIGLNDIYHSWCLDEDATIWSGFKYTGLWVISSYDKQLLDETYVPVLPEVDHREFIERSIKNPTELPKVNWILNKFHEEITEYSKCDIQAAIWSIVDDIDPLGQTRCVEDLDIVKVDEIIDEAAAHADFEPECGEEIALVVLWNPEGIWSEQHLQASIIHVPVPCTYEWSSDTAWGGEYPDIRFTDSDWAIWFPYTVQPEL